MEMDGDGRPGEKADLSFQVSVMRRIQRLFLLIYRCAGASMADSRQ